MFLTGWKEWTIAGLTALGVYSMYWIAGSYKGIQASSPEAESYEMQRVRDTYFAQFDLSHRDIEYSRVEETSPHQKQGQIASGTPATVNRAPTPMNAQTKQVKKDKKNDKKKQVKKAGTKQTQVARSGLTIDTVDTSRKSTPSHESMNQRTGYQSAYTNVPVTPQVKAPVVTAEDNTEQEPKLSSGQWYSLLQAQPTLENAMKFRQAKADLGEKAYYEIVSKLLKDSQLDRQKAGLAILSSDPSLGTFQFLVKTPSEGNMAASLKALLQSYGKNKARFGVLAQAMASADSEVVLVAEALVLAAVQSISADNQTAGTGSTGGRVATLTKNDFMVFKSVLGRLLRSSNTQIAQNARQIYSSVWQDLPSAPVATGQ